MAAAAILNLWFFSILIKRSVSSGSRLHHCKISFICVNRRLSYWCLYKKFKMAAAAILDLIFVYYFGIPACRTSAILNYNFVMLDHPRSPFVHLQLPLKFRVDRVRTFRDIAIRKFRKFGLKCLFRPPKIMFWGVLTPRHYFLSSRPTKGDTLRGNTRLEP